MAAQEQSGSGTQFPSPAAPAPPALPFPPLPGIPDGDAINRAVAQKLADKGNQKVEQARQRLDQAKDKLLEVSKAYSSNRNSDNKERLNDAKAEVKDAAHAFEEAVTQNASSKWSGQNGITIDLGNSRRNSSSGGSGGSGNETVPIVAIVFLFLYLIVRAIMAPFTRKNRVQSSLAGGSGFSQDETALMQKMQRTLGQMETRVEALETILIEQQSSQRSRRMAGATVGAASRGGAPSSGTLRSNPNI